jgi:Matrixin
MRRSSPAQSRRAPLSGALAATLALVTLAPARGALAYCRTATCAPNTATAVTGALCNPAQPSDCPGGIALAWPTSCVTFSFQKDASKQVSLSAAEGIFRKAFAAWTHAACPGGGSPRIEVTEFDPVECTKHEYNQKACNANAIIFRDSGWPYEGASNMLALTTVTYNLDNGQIYDADMELNTAGAIFTTGDSKVNIDLLSVVTHETGHFLGLAHSVDTTSTMFPAYQQGDISLRNLAPDDIAGICAIYPPGDPIAEDCDATPRHGFSTACAADQAAGATCIEGKAVWCSCGELPSGGCCAVAPGLPAGEGTAAAAVAALGAVLLGMRRRRRPG